MTPNLGSKYPKCVLTQIRLFLFISDVFLCISTIIFSKNMKLPNGRFLENLDSTVSTGHLEQTSTLFGIFHQGQGVQGSYRLGRGGGLTELYSVGVPPIVVQMTPSEFSSPSSTEVSEVSKDTPHGS